MVQFFFFIFFLLLSFFTQTNTNKVDEGEENYGGVSKYSGRFIRKSHEIPPPISHISTDCFNSLILLLHLPGNTLFLHDEDEYTQQPVDSMKIQSYNLHTSAGVN